MRKRVIRRINKSKYEAHTDPIFKKLNLLTFQDIDVSSWSYFKKTYLPSKILKTYTRETTKSTAKTQGMQTLFVRRYVKQIFHSFSVFFESPKFS